MQENLNRYWPSLVSSNNNKDFWNHEWKKHGTCANLTDLKSNRLSSSSDETVLYFQKSLEIFKKLKVEDLFNQNNYFYSFDDLEKAIKNRINSNNFDSICYYDKADQKQYIKELRFKFDKNLDLSTNDTLLRDSNCHRSKPIYVYQERVFNYNSSSNILNACIYLYLLMIASLLL